MTAATGGTFRLSDNFLKKYKRKRPPFGFNGLGELVYMRCVTTDTPVLCGDLQWREAGTLKEGDTLLAFDENLDEKTSERYLRKAVVTHNVIETAEVFGIELENGEILYATPEHQWLAYRNGGFKWIPTKDLVAGIRGAKTSLPKWSEVWEFDDSYISGFLAAAFDGEGSLDKATNVAFIQVDNALLNKVEKFLDKKGFEYSKTYRSPNLGNQGLYSIKITGGREELLRFLGTIRPPRLLEKYLERIENISLRSKLENRSGIVRIFPAGEKEIAVMSTTSKTHFTAGYPSHNTYSRIKEDGKNEVWWETVKRVVEGTYNMQMRHIEGHSLGWNPWKSQRSAQEMYDRIFNLKFTPPGRGLWMGGTDYVLERGVEMGLFNCSFVSTEFIDKDLTMPFCFLMDASMLGVGVGFDVKGEGKVIIKGFTSKDPLVYVIPDSREGWVESVRLLVDHIVSGREPIEFDYSEIRGAGVPIKGFGGVSSGPGPLKDLHIDLLSSFNDNVDLPITITTIVDTMNMIGKCVVSGNVRRTAELALGPPDSDEYLDLKNYEMNPNRESFGWTSNNSILAELGMDYGPAAKRIKVNGEPGFLWLENVRAYSRIRNGKDWKDSRAEGTNPCVEQSLEHAECCCLVETFPNNHDSLEDYLKTLKYAYLYGKTVTLAKTHWPETNRVMLRNRRIGLSLSGITQFVTDRGLDVLREWCEKGYEEIQRLDKIYSDWMAIPKSIKTTSVKPSGSVSLLAGATPGVHYPESRFYIRRMRLSAHSKLIPNLKKAGYRVEPAVQGIDTVIVEVPVDIGKGVKTLKDVTIWEQLSLAAFMQKYWADNQVSCTVTFDPDTEGDEIEAALNFFQYQLKGISFLPRHEIGAYEQMPYEAIDEETYNKRLAELGTLSFRSIKGHEAVLEKFCTNDVCEIPTS